MDLRIGTAGVRAPHTHHLRNHLTLPPRTALALFASYAQAMASRACDGAVQARLHVSVKVTVRHQRLTCTHSTRSAVAQMHSHNMAVAKPRSRVAPA